MKASWVHRISVSSPWSSGLFVAIVIAVTVMITATPSAGSEKNDEGDLPKFVKVKIGHRIHLDFEEEVTAQMNERYYVGDTDISFEATAFYPHFAIVDSTREIISLSDELKNPAFKILVYENDELIDETWAFYAFHAPHFSRTFHVSFQVLAFEYRGTVYDQSEHVGDASKNEGPPAIEEDGDSE